MTYHGLPGPFGFAQGKLRPGLRDPRPAKGAA